MKPFSTGHILKDTCNIILLKENTEEKKLT